MLLKLMYTNLLLEIHVLSVASVQSQNMRALGQISEITSLSYGFAR